MKKRKKKSPLKGKPSSKVSKQRSIEHLDPQSETHQADKKAFAKIRKRAKKAREVGLANTNPRAPLKFSSLGGGFCVARDLTTLSSEEHNNLLEGINSERNNYNSHSINKEGEISSRRRKTSPLQQLAVTFRPDLAMTFEQLEKDKSPPLKSFLLTIALPAIFEEFEQTTGLEIIAAQIHPEEGMLHFHITYTHVSADLELLWGKSGSGRRGLRLLGPSSLGVLRLATVGFLTEDIAEKANQHLKYRTDEMGGDTPIDLKLAYTLDGLCTHFFERKDRHPHWVKSAKKYREDLEVRLQQRPESLKASNEFSQQKIRELENEIAKLKKAKKKKTDQNDPLLERLAFLPDHILYGADLLKDITDALLAQNDQVSLAYLTILSHNPSVPLTHQEREQIRAELEFWQKSNGQDFGIEK